MTMPAFVSLLCLVSQALTPEVIEHAQAGASAQKQGKYDVAIQEFGKVTELQPKSASGHANLGEAYFHAGNYPAAIKELEEALQLNPNLMGSQQTLGVALLIQGDAAGALPHLEKTKTPELVGLAYLETGRLGSAVIALQTALERQPDDPDLLYYYGRATALAAQRTMKQIAAMRVDATKNDARPSQDVAALEMALAKTPNDPALLLDFGKAATEASKRAFDKILQVSPDSARAHQVKAERDAESGRMAEAEKEYGEALRLRPYTAEVRLALGNVLLSEGNLAAATAQFGGETKLRPLSGEAFYRLGSVLLQQGQAVAALKELSRADRLRPDAPAILLVLGQAALAVHDDATARKAWMRLLELTKDGELAENARQGLASMEQKTGENKD